MCWSAITHTIVLFHRLELCWSPSYHNCRQHLSRQCMMLTEACDCVQGLPLPTSSPSTPSLTHSSPNSTMLSRRLTTLPRGKPGFQIEWVLGMWEEWRDTMLEVWMFEIMYCARLDCLDIGKLESSGNTISKSECVYVDWDTLWDKLTNILYF